ncbi:cyclic pyranopterin phosphate synthase [Lachnospiraceae bacterium PFB1-22]
MEDFVETVKSVIFPIVDFGKGCKRMGLSHIDKDGNARMVDVGEKENTKRRAVACGKIYMSEECFQIVAKGAMKKGDVLGVAQIAGIMGTKRTGDLIPLCHSLALTKSKVTFTLLEDEHGILGRCEVTCEGKTGVEMEALTGVSIALLTVYDMCKGVDKSMHMEEIFLLEKEGGKSGRYERSV